jgi:hypothetical protein
VITVVVAHVVDDCVVVSERLQDGRVAAVIVASKLCAYFWIRRLKAVYEESDLRTSGEVRQKLLAVVGYSRRLRIERAEISQFHNK